MNPRLPFFPFLAFLIAAIGTAIGSSTGSQYIGPVSWGLAVLTIAIWIYVDFDFLAKIFSRKGAKYGASSGAAIVLAMVLIVGLAYITSKPRFNKSWDVTKAGINTLSDQSEKVIEKMRKDNAKIDVVAFFSSDPSSEISKGNFQRLLGLYLEKGAPLSVQYKNTSVDFEEAKAAKLTNPDTVIFRNGPTESRITLFDEEKVTNALSNILKGKAKNVVFTEGHGEGKLDAQDGDGFLIAKNEMEANNFVVKQVSLIAEPESLKTADLVIMAGAKYDVEPQEVKLLEDYLANGGSLLIAVSALTPIKNLETLANKYGIEIGHDYLVLNPNSQQAEMFGRNTAVVSEFVADNSITRDFAEGGNIAVLFPATRSVKRMEKADPTFKVEEIAKTTAPLTIRLKDIRTVADLKGNLNTKVDASNQSVVVVASKQVEAPKAADGADTTTPKTKGFRLVIAGSGGLVANYGTEQAANRDLLANVVNYLAQDEDFISIRPPKPGKSTIDLASPGSQLSLAFISFIYPFVFLGSGMLYWFYRRR